MGLKKSGSIYGEKEKICTLECIACEIQGVFIQSPGFMRQMPVFSVPSGRLPSKVVSSLTPLKADLVVVLGGSISAYEERAYPFLVDELKFLERRLAEDLPTLVSVTVSSGSHRNWIRALVHW